MLNKAYAVIEIKEVNETAHIIRGIATSPKPDRLGDIVEPEGVKVADSIPLFLHHDSHLIVGRAKLGKATRKGIPFEATLPEVKEQGKLKDRVEEAWQSVKYGLITGVSIGFRPLNDAIESIKGGGLRFIETEILELSLVPVPAQPDAVIQGFKRMDSASQEIILKQIKSADQAALRAAHGASRVLRVSRKTAGNGSPDASGQVHPFSRYLFPE